MIATASSATAPPTSSVLTRRTVLATLAASTTIFSAACATGGDAQQSSSALLDPTTARSISFWPRNATDKIAFDAMLPFARERFPNLTVNIEVPATAILEKLKVAVASDTPPDGIVLGLGSARHIVAQKMV